MNWETFKAQGIPGRLEAARLGLNPTVIARLPSGWAVLGDSQRLPGYALLLADPAVPSLHDLPTEKEQEFLRDMALLGRAIQDVTACGRINFGIYGNTDPYLHAHIHPRYAWEEPLRAKHPVWKRYPTEELFGDAALFDFHKHAALMRQLQARLLELNHTHEAKRQPF